MIRSKLFAAFLLLAVNATPSLAEIQFNIEEPSEGSTKSGIGQFSGWAVSDGTIVSVEAIIDGTSLGVMPYGGSRMDVAAVFTDMPDSEHAGWAMKWNYSLLEDGEHLLTIVVTEDDGNQMIKEVAFYTTGFNSEFISNPQDVQTAGSAIESPADGLIVITGATVEGATVDVSLSWDTASQQFLIDKVLYDDEPQENQSPTANAGSNKTVEAGTTVVVEGAGSDPDGHVSHVAWSQVSGPEVSLIDSDKWAVQFTAPDQASDIRLRLTVTDDGGMSDSDDVIIQVAVPTPEPDPDPDPNPEPDPDPNPEPDPDPEPNQSPVANAGSDRTVQEGNNVVITGSGSDPDGSVEGWSWAQISGTNVNLTGANSQQVQFTAPNSAGDIRLRLTVTDNEGATDTDDVVITVEAVPEPDNTTGFTLESMLPLINDARGQTRFCGSDEYPAQPPLEWSSSLADIARQHSMDMASQGYFSHTSLDGTSMGDRVFPYWSGSTVGENIAASSSNRSDQYIVDLWLNSPGHCALIMSPNFTHAGVGTGHNNENGYTYHHFWTLDFGG